MAMDDILDRPILDDFPGLLIKQGPGIHWPVYVPRYHNEKPGWDVFYRPIPSALKSLVENALENSLSLSGYTFRRVHDGFDPSRSRSKKLDA